MMITASTVASSSACSSRDRMASAAHTAGVSDGIVGLRAPCAASVIFRQAAAKGATYLPQGGTHRIALPSASSPVRIPHARGGKSLELRGTRGMPGVEKLTSILVVVERSDYAHRGLAKAVVLARHFGARLELFLCDAEQAHQLRRLYDPRGVEEARAACLADARRYLESMRHFVAAQDIDIELDVACESPMYEGVLRKVLRSRPDLVIKTIDTRGPSERPGL